MYFSYKHRLFIGVQFNQQLVAECQQETISHLDTDGYGTTNCVTTKFLTSKYCSLMIRSWSGFYIFRPKVKT